MNVMDALKDIIESKTPFDFNIWSYVSLRGEHMIIYCFRTKMDRFQIAKVIDENGPAEWKRSLRTARMRPDRSAMTTALTHSWHPAGRSKGDRI